MGIPRIRYGIPRFPRPTVSRRIESLSPTRRRISNCKRSSPMNYSRVALAAVVATVVFFVYGFLVEGMLIRKDFAPSAVLYRDVNAQMKYMPIGIASALLALFAAAALYAKWCGGVAGVMTGLEFGLLMGIFTACVHAV